MARQLRIEFPGAFYHVTARGNERKAVFKSIKDKDKFLKKKPQDRELPSLLELVDRPDISTISDMFDSVIQTDDRLAKQIKLYFCHRYSGLKLKEIGKYFGIGQSGVSQTSRRLSDKLKRNKKLSKKVAIVKKKLKL